MRTKGAFEEKVVGCVITAGAGIAVIALFLAYLFGTAGVFHGTYTREPLTNRITDPGTLNLVPLAILFVAIGVLMIFGGIGYGLFRNATSAHGPRRTEPYLRVLARYVYDRGHLLTSDLDIEMAERPRYYVRVLTQAGVVIELESTVEVFYQSGEGMYGEGELQGNWLGRFTPYIGEPPAASSP